MRAHLPTAILLTLGTLPGRADDPEMHHNGNRTSRYSSTEVPLVVLHGHEVLEYRSRTFSTVKYGLVLEDRPSRP